MGVPLADFEAEVGELEEEPGGGFLMTLPTWPAVLTESVQGQHILWP